MSISHPAPGWVERLKALDSDAWAEFYERYKHDFLKFARHLVAAYNSRIDPEDLVQDGIVRMMERIATFDEAKTSESVDPIRAWGCTILRNLVRDGKRQDTKLPVDDTQDTELLTSKPPVLAPLSPKKRKMLAAIEKAKDRLTPSELVKFELVYEQETDYKNLAKELGVKPQSAKVMLSRFKSKFERLAKEIYRQM